MQVLFEKFLGDFRTFFTARITDFKGFVVVPQYIVPGVSHLVPGGAVCVFGEDTLSLRFASSGIRLCRAKPANRRKPAAHIVPLWTMPQPHRLFKAPMILHHSQTKRRRRNNSQRLRPL